MTLKFEKVKDSEDFWVSDEAYLLGVLDVDRKAFFFSDKGHSLDLEELKQLCQKIEEL